MKYVRTKDGVYEKTLVSICELDGIEYASNDEMNYAKIIKQADTIPELCDVFDRKWNETEFPYSIARQHDRYDGYGDLKRGMRGEENYGKYLNQDYEIYGAIWTDKGLVYVAKMNDKGELELI